MIGKIQTEDIEMAGLASDAIVNEAGEPEVPHVTLGITPATDRSGRFLVVAANGVGEFHRDNIDLNSAISRKRFINETVGKTHSKGSLEELRVTLEKQLLDAAKVPPGNPERADHLMEVDVSRVVRPELFHANGVSGLTVAVLLDVGGKLTPRWRTHLRWADGKRDVIDAPDRLVLPAGNVLYVRPDAGDPPESDPPAWSADSRRGWIDGADCPDPCAVFRDVCGKFAEYLDFPPGTASGTTATLALWTVLSYLYPAWDAVPYLYVGGPMGSGKSRVLDVLQRLAFRPVSSSNLTAPTLFRTLHASGGTMLFDEAERLRQSTPEQLEIQSVFLSGYRRGGCATRLEAVGDSFRPVRFDVFGPKALACIAGLPPTLASRCIPITMFRSATDSPKPKLRIDANPAGWQSVRDDLHILALEHGEEWLTMASCKSVVPSGIGGRNYELWQPLLAIAGWLQDRGATGLLELLQRYALASVANAKDDAVPEADEVLLELVAEAVREGRHPTSAEILSSAKFRDEVTFKLWLPRTVTARLKNYGIAASPKTNGDRRYREVTHSQVFEIQNRYGVELGMV